MRGRTVGHLTLERRRALDILLVQERLGCSFESRGVQGTQCYQINGVGENFELLLRRPKFFEAQLQLGAGDAVDLVMHEPFDFKGATDLLRTLAI